MAKDVITLEHETEVIVVDPIKAKFDILESELQAIQLNLSTVNEKSLKELDDLIEFARASQNAKVYEALTKMLLAITQINKETAAVVKQKQDLYESALVEKRATPENLPTGDYIDQRTITNNFTGTTSELLKKLRDGDNEST